MASIKWHAMPSSLKDHEFLHKKNILRNFIILEISTFLKIIIIISVEVAKVL
jgi:hypothetical protein